MTNENDSCAASLTSNAAPSSLSGSASVAEQKAPLVEGRWYACTYIDEDGVEQEPYLLQYLEGRLYSEDEGGDDYAPEHFDRLVLQS